MKTYKQIEPNFIQTTETHDDGSFTSGIISRGQVKTDQDGNSFSPWDDLIASDAVIVDETLQTAKDAAIAKINRERDQAIRSGVEYNNNTYQSDDKSIADLIAVATLSIINNDIIVPWLTSENEVVDLDSTDIQLLAGLFAAQKTAHVIEARKRKDLVILAETIEQVEAI
jgi:hypothetical protein